MKTGTSGDNGPNEGPVRKPALLPKGIAMKRRHYLLTAFAVVALAVAAPAIADKGGNPNGGNGNGNGQGNGNGGGDSAQAWVSVSPNPAAAGGSQVWVEGCGYDVDYPVELRVVHSAGYTEAWGVGVWYTGCMNPTPLTTSEAGTYTLEVYQRSSRQASLKASTSLTVS